MLWLTVITLVCIFGSVLSETPSDELTCLDWQNKTVQNGEEYYPKARDPCHMCTCVEGFKTMCKDVSCQPPSCPNWKPVQGKCCKFECMDENLMGVTDGSPTHSSSMTDMGLRLVASTVTMFLLLALLMFFIHRFRQRRLLMALRRYSRRRGEPLDESDYSPDFDSIHSPPYEDPPPPYTPPKPLPGEAPPPYDAIDGPLGGTDVDRNFNRGSGLSGHAFIDPPIIDGRSNVTHSNVNQGQGHLTQGHTQMCTALRESNRHSAGGMNSDARHSVPSNRNSGFNSSDTAPLECLMGNGCHSNMGDSEVVEFGRPQQCPSAIARNNAVMDTRNVAVHFRNNSCGHPCITMGVQNRSRNQNHRNRFSDISLSNHTSPVRHAADGRNSNSVVMDNTRALNLELRNTVNNLRSANLRNSPPVSSGVDEQLSSSTTDIGESTTSAESLTSSPESPNYETDNNCAQFNSVSTSNNNNTDVKSDDADSTVKRFLDRHFGAATGTGRCYPTTMSQSWTNAGNPSPNQSFKQSISLTAFPSSSDTGVQVEQPQTARKMNQNLPRSKSEHLKTNGSLINQPYNGLMKSQKSQAPVHAGRAVRVAYKDADEISERGTGNQSVSNRGSQGHSAEIRNSVNDRMCNSVTSERNTERNSSLDRTMDTDTCDQASICTNVSDLAMAILDPGEIIVTKRQDELRNLRLAHLMHQPVFDSELSNQSVSINSNGRQLQRSLSENSVESSTVSGPSEQADQSNLNAAIRNDAKYPANSYKHFLQTCLTGRPVGQIAGNQSSGQSTQSDGHSWPQEQTGSSMKSQRASVPVNASMSGRETRSNQSSPRKALPRSDARGRAGDNAFVRSWHAGFTQDSCDENTEAASMNTLVRNVNGHFEKKPCGDKDVTNVFLPHYKQSNIELGMEVDRGSVPSSEMRACASQLYNYETEECQMKKDKRKQLFKRHSTGCFPVKHDRPNPSTRTNPPSKVKSSQDRQLINNSNHHNDKHRGSSSRDRKSSRRQVINNEREDGQRRKEISEKACDLAPPYLMHSAIPTDFTLLNRGLLFNTALCQEHSKSDSKRSRSLGRNESSHSNRKSARDTSTGSSNRKKKGGNARQANLFQSELEHVLDQQKSLMKTGSPSKSGRHSYNETDRNNCAITQV